MSSLTTSPSVSLSFISQTQRWLPALALPAAVLLWAGTLPPWIVAWLLTFALYVGFKWLALVSSRAARTAPLSRSLRFLFLWPGMDADAFLAGPMPLPPTIRESLFAVVNLGTGVGLVFVAARFVVPGSPWLGGWLGLVGLAMCLLFGFAHLVSIVWRMLGFAARPIMNQPHRASSLADFWGNRWNLAFHDIGRLFVFHPLHRRFGATAAVVAVFLFSGLVHDLVMSLPVRRNFGWPSLYFLVQCAGVLLERSPVGKRFQLGRGWRGRIYASAFVLLPLTWLFHDAFVLQIIVPTLQWLAS